MNQREYFSRAGVYKVNHFGTLQNLRRDKRDIGKPCAIQ